MPKKAIKKTPKEAAVLPLTPEPEQAPLEEEDDIVFREEEEQKPGVKEKYYQAIGRRKNSIARVRLYTKKSVDQNKDEGALITVNGKDYTLYFTDSNLRLVIESALRKLKSLNRFKASIVVNGGGLSGQAGAVRHGLARALILFDLNFKKKLKKAGFLTRDPRAKERRKYGHRKARKSKQWSKR